MKLTAKVEDQFSREFLSTWVNWDLIKPSEIPRNWSLDDEFFLFTAGYEI
jgi:hypothetical protein